MGSYVPHIYIPIYTRRKTRPPITSSTTYNINRLLKVHLVQRPLLMKIYTRIFDIDIYRCKIIYRSEFSSTYLGMYVVRCI